MRIKLLPMEFGFTLIFLFAMQIASVTAAFFIGYYIYKNRFEKSIEHKIEVATELAKKIKPTFHKVSSSIKLKRHASK